MTYPETDGEDRRDTEERGCHTTIQTKRTILLDDLLKAVERVLVHTLRGLETDLDQVKGLTAYGTSCCEPQDIRDKSRQNLPNHHGSHATETAGEERLDG